MGRLRRRVRDGWLLVSACVATTAALSFKDFSQELVAEEKLNDAIHDLADEKAQLSGFAGVDGDAVRPAAPTQRGELAAHAAAQQRSPSALRGVQKQTTVRAEEVAASDDGGLGGSSPLESESQRLHEMIASTNGDEKKLETQLKKVPLLQLKVASEKKLGRKLEMQLHSARRAVAHYKRDLYQARRHRASLQRENSDLSGAVQNMTTARLVLETELVKSIYHRDEVEVALGKANTALSNSGGARHAVKKLRQRLRQAEERAAKEERLSKIEKAAARNAFRRLAHLQQDLNSTARKLAGQVARNDQLNKAPASLAEQLQAERAAVSKGAVRFQRLSTANHKIAKLVAFLKRRVADNDNVRKHAHAVAAETKNSLARAGAEVKQVKGLVPWLQDKAAAGELELKQAASETRAAYEARDVATAMEDEAQRKIAHLEQQYASVAQDLAARRVRSPPPGREESQRRPPPQGEEEHSGGRHHKVLLRRRKSQRRPPPQPNLIEVASWTSAEYEAVLGR